MRVAVAKPCREALADVLLLEIVFEFGGRHTTNCTKIERSREFLRRFAFRYSSQLGIFAKG